MSACVYARIHDVRCMYVRMLICVYVYMCMYMYMRMYMYMYMYMYACMCVWVYIIYIYIYTYFYAYGAQANFVKACESLSLEKAAVAEPTAARYGREPRNCAVPQAVARIHCDKEEEIAILRHARPSGDHFAPTLGRRPTFSHWRSGLGRIC